MSIEFGDSLVDIGVRAFVQSGLTHVLIPRSVTNIGAAAFATCTNLLAIDVAAMNPTYRSIGGVLFDETSTDLIACPAGRAGTYTIADTVIRIGASAFGGCVNLTSVTIPDSVTNIGSGAFGGCGGLPNLTIPESVTDIGGFAFSGCTSLTNIAIPNRVSNIGDYTFWGCTNLIGVTIGSSVTNIGYWAFSGCLNLPSVTIPDRVTRLEWGAFYGCRSLTTVRIGSRVTNIGEMAFESCPSLMGVFFKGNAFYLVPFMSYAFGGDTNATVYYLPGTTGWGPTFGGLPTALWVLPNPVILTTAPNFGVRTNRFGFIISWATNASVVVEACTNLADPAWSSVGTNTLVEGWSYFSDPEWTNYASRFYRIRSP